MPLDKLAFTLIAMQGPPSWAAAAIWLHFRPRMRLVFGGIEVALQRRWQGLVTGACSSGILARIPVLTTALDALQRWLGHCFRLDDSESTSAFAAADWADNLCTFGKTATDAVLIAEDWAARLFRDWSLRIGGTRR